MRKSFFDFLFQKPFRKRKIIVAAGFPVQKTIFLNKSNKK